MTGKYNVGAAAALTRGWGTASAATNATTAHTASKIRCMYTSLSAAWHVPVGTHQTLSIFFPPQAYHLSMDATSGARPSFHRRLAHAAPDRACIMEHTVAKLGVEHNTARDTRIFL
jgi:hypothetical protein